VTDAASPEFPIYEPGAKVRFGTSSFSSKDWVGPFYPPGTPPGDFLSTYATRFDAVEVDATYYAIPTRRMVAGWEAKTPSGFLFAAKFPRTIVHGGDQARPDARRVLDPDSTYEERDRFLDVMSALGPKLGALLLQFPYFNRAAFPSPGPFLERLDVFLRDLPRGDWTLGVEVRNRGWVTPDLRAVLERHQAALVLVDQAWMPHGDEVARRMDPVVGGRAYVRLLGDRERIEALTRTWDREVIDPGERLERWARLLAAFLTRDVTTLVFVNNHYAGHAPTTTRRLRALFEAERSNKAGSQE